MKKAMYFCLLGLVMLAVLPFIPLLIIWGELFGGAENHGPTISGGDF